MTEENQLSFDETLNRVQSIEEYLVNLLFSIPSDSKLYFELNNAHCSVIKSRQLLQNSGSLAQSSLFASVGEG